jgi:hypothetical protein
MQGFVVAAGGSLRVSNGLASDRKNKKGVRCDEMRCISN